MMGKNPMKRGLNGYSCCDNDLVNYVDPTGEIANIVAGGIVRGVVIGTVKGALISSGAGIGLSLVADFIGGAAGSA